MDNLYEVVAETEGHIHLSRAIHLEKDLEVFVVGPQFEEDLALSGIALSDPSLADDWLNPDEEEAWAHLQWVM
ncbi:MAG: hypothetical protein EBV30_10905 [Actinobacteria bacterium]|nr:hypothetical protein [Actinomycetota bacterium]